MENKNKFYETTWFMWATLVFFAPVGIFLMFKYDRFSKASKSVVTIIFGLWFLIIAINSLTSKPSVDNNVTATSAPKTTQSSTNDQTKKDADNKIKADADAKVKADQKAKDDAAAKTKADAEVALKKMQIQPGMYKVGVDIQAAEYVVVSDSSGYVEVTKDSTGALESIVMNDNIQGRVYVTISSGQYFTTKNAIAYVADKAPKVAPIDNKLPDGEYKVGVDIQPGEYKVSSVSGGYVEVAKNSLHGIESIVSNDNFTGDKYITIAAGQYITIRNGNILLNK